MKQQLYRSLFLAAALFVSGSADAGINFGLPSAVKSAVKKLHAAPAAAVSDVSTTTTSTTTISAPPSGVKQWTRQLGTALDDWGSAVAVDASGNVYVAGSTNGGLDGNTNAGSSDLFLVKYSSSGVKQWTRELGTASAELALGVATDASGNIFVAGHTDGGLDGNTSAGGTDLFVVKYSSAGTKQWTRQLGTAASDLALAVATDLSGNIFVAGYTAGGLDGNTSAGGTDMFLVKYNAAGVKQWTRQLGTATSDQATGVATDASGNIYVSGYTDGGLDGNTNAGTDDLFLVKYNAAGVKQWTRQLGSALADFGEAVATDPSGNIFVTGRTYGGLDGNTLAGVIDLFLVKYNASGVKQWTRQLGTTTTDLGLGVTTDASGDIFVGGYTDGGLDGNTHVGGIDIYLVKYDASGAKQWTKQLGTAADEWATGLAADSYGNVYAAGETSGGLDGNTSAGGRDLFLVSYSQ